MEWHAGSIRRKEFQFTPLREGRRWGGWQGCCTAHISIHAPAGGATQRRGGPCTDQRISIHAPAGGATLPSWPPVAFMCYFNSRPCGRGDGHSGPCFYLCFQFQFTPLREGRPAYLNEGDVSMAISIHAPAGGATRHRVLLRQSLRISIHAPAGGATARNAPEARAKIFQFTPLREGRRWKHRKSTRFLIFQFTPLREGRPLAPRYRVTPKTYFNSRPCGRGDASVFCSWANVCYFNSRPCGRGDPLLRSATWHAAGAYFNSRPCGRGDPGARG